MTRSDNILDLVFTSECDRVGNICFAAPFSTCDHIPILFNYQYCQSPSPGKHNPNLNYDWIKSDFSAMDALFDTIDWDLLLDEFHIKASNSAFIQQVLTARDLFTPPKSPRGLCEPWLKSIPSSFKSDVKAYWSNYKHRRAAFGRHAIETQRAWCEYRAKSRSLKSATTKAIATYELSLVKSRANLKPFHRYIRRKKKCPPSIGLLVANGVSTGECLAMSSIFTSSFSSVCVSNDLPSPEPHQTSDVPIDLPDLLPSDIYLQLCKLRPSVSCGPDQIPDIVLKKCAKSLCYPHSLTHLDGMVEYRLSHHITVTNGFRAANGGPPYSQIFDI